MMMMMMMMMMVMIMMMTRHLEEPAERGRTRVAADAGGRARRPAGRAGRACGRAGRAARGAGRADAEELLHARGRVVLRRHHGRYAEW